jgi:hypothetical protein
MRSIVTAIILSVLGFAAPALADTSFFVGDRISVSAGPLNVRMSASIYDAPYGKQPVGAQGIIFQGPIEKDGYVWWFIDYDKGVDGWSVQNYLTKPSAQAAAVATSVEFNQMQAIYWQLKNILTVLQGLKSQ